MVVVARACLLSVALVLVPATAAARVRVTRTDDAPVCPDPAAYEALTREGTRGARDVDVRFSRTATGYASSIVTADGMARALEDAACDALAEATLVVVRLALEEPAPGATPADRDQAGTAPARPASERPGPRAEAMLGAAGVLGLGVSVAPGLRAGGGVVFGEGRWSVGVTGLAVLPQSKQVGPGAVELGLLGGGLEGCGRLTRGALAGALCARGELYRIAGAGRGLARDAEAARLFPAATLLLRGRARVAGPVGVFAEIGAVLPLVRERFAVDGAGILYDPPAVAGTASTGLAVDFE